VIDDLERLWGRVNWNALAPLLIILGVIGLAAIAAWIFG
jgi:hypothetical protein